MSITVTAHRYHITKSENMNDSEVMRAVSRNSRNKIIWTFNLFESGRHAAGLGWAGLALWTLGRSSELRQPRHETSHEGNLLAHATIIFNLQVAVLLAGMLRPAAAGHARPAKLTKIMSTPCPSINSYSYSWKQNTKLDTLFSIENLWFAIGLDIYTCNTSVLNIWLTGHKKCWL